MLSQATDEDCEIGSSSSDSSENRPELCPVTENKLSEVMEETLQQGGSQSQGQMKDFIMSSWEKQKLWEFARCLGDARKEALCETVKGYGLVLRKQEEARVKYLGRLAKEQVPLRPNTIAFLRGLAEKYKLSRRTLHHAIYLFDRFNDSKTIPENRKRATAVACFLLAAKFEECEFVIPKMSAFFVDVYPDELLKSHHRPNVQHEFTIKICRDLEHEVLRFFDYRLLVPTIIDFVEFYALFIVDPNDIEQLDECNNVLKSELSSMDAQTRATIIRDGQLRIQKISNQLVAEVFWNVDLMVEVEQDEKWCSSLIAAAIVLYVRRRNGYKGWSGQLATAALYDLATVDDCLKKFVEAHCDHHPPSLAGRENELSLNLKHNFHSTCATT